MKGRGIKMQGHTKTLEKMCEGTHCVNDKARKLQLLGHFIGNLQGKMYRRTCEKLSRRHTKLIETCTRGVTRESFKHACSEMLPNRTFLAPLTNGTLKQHIMLVWSNYGSYSSREMYSSQNTHGETKQP